VNSVPPHSSKTNTYPQVGRAPIGSALRFDVLARCNFACYYCGVPAARGVVRLQIDHVVPISLGGTNDLWNLVAACQPCNAGKGPGCPSAELVRQVRDDHYFHVSVRQTFDLVQCRDCGLPFNIDGEDYTDQCERCNAIMCHGYDVGCGRTA
jgi:hypothetical protein